MNKIKSFEQYLMDSCWEAEGILDDDMPDAFDAWLGDIDTNEIISFADEWGNTLLKKIDLLEMQIGELRDKEKYNG